MSIFNQLLKKPLSTGLYCIISHRHCILLLNLPFVHKPNVNVNPIDTLFVAVSGISVTGLSPVNIVDTYSTFGQVIILIILNIGGIGVMAIGTYMGCIR